MKAIILAAGQGTRLKKYTRDLPKGMLMFMGKTIIERQIEMYRHAGIKQIIIVRGFAADRINYGGVKYYTNDRFAQTNMVESLMVAKEEFNDGIIVSYSDVLFEERMLVEMMEFKADYACAVDDNWKEYWQLRYGSVNFDTESLVIDSDNCITELGLENPPDNRIDSRYVGLLKFSETGLHKIMEIMQSAYEKYADKPWQQSGKTAYKAYMTDLLNAIIQSGAKVKAVRFNNGWIEFDTNEDYEKAMDWANNGTLSNLIKLNLI